MKKYILLLVVGLLSLGCGGQDNETKKNKKEETKTGVTKEPKATWNVNKEFDENGNLIRYDSIYSWSSNDAYNNHRLFNTDSLMQTFKSGFENKGFENAFVLDSIFSQHVFNDHFFGNNFGDDITDIDKLRQQMIAMQRKFLEQYQSEFIKPEQEN